MLSECFSTGQQAQCPVTFDHWYTQPALCRFGDTILKVP
jgi:hypothetical protein